MTPQYLNESHVDFVMRETGEDRPKALDLIYQIACQEQFGIVIADDVVISPDELRARDHSQITTFRAAHLRGFERLDFPNAAAVELHGC